MVRQIGKRQKPNGQKEGNDKEGIESIKTLGKKK